jgi:uncharacterized membrane protein
MLLAAFFIVPLLLMVGEKHLKPIQWISPIMLCYALGILLANLPFISLDNKLAISVSEIAVPVAIPLLLFSTQIRSWLSGAKSAMVSFGLCVLAVMLSATFASFYFRDTLDEVWKLAGMTIGVYTGGTPNMGAIGLSLGVSEETFVLLNASDMVWGSCYLVMLMTIAKPVLSRLLPVKIEIHEDQSENSTNEPTVKSLVSFFLLACCIVSVALGVSYLLFGEFKAIFIILTVTSLGIGGSFITAIRETPGSYTLGEYFLLVFCFALGTQADIPKLIESASQTLLFTGMVMFGAIVLHLFFAWVLRIDRDTAIITSVAGIYGPAFVGPIAKVLNNKSIVLTGMTTGLIGYAIGNYLGITFALLLKNWFPG